MTNLRKFLPILPILPILLAGTMTMAPAVAQDRHLDVQRDDGQYERHDGAPPAAGKPPAGKPSVGAPPVVSTPGGMPRDDGRTRTYVLPPGTTYVLPPGTTYGPPPGTVLQFYPQPWWQNYCVDDVTQFCPGYGMNDVNTLVCLGSHINELSPNCRAAF